MAEASGSDANATENIVEINITDTERRCAGSAVPLQDIYVAYQVESIIREPEKTPYIVWRRYSDFEVLHSHLQDSFPYVIIPPLPERKVMYRWQKLPSDRLDPDFCGEEEG
uniref:Putative sorting nexin n=1 Tax=Ixodes ricinus TaxID=34613 RepID=A0A0K8RCE1_IXORI